MRVFTPDRWARCAGIPLAQAILFTNDLVALHLAERVGVGKLYRLTPRGIAVISALKALLTEIEDAP